MKTSAKRRVNRADQTAQEHSAVEFLDFSLTLENIEVLRNIDFKVTAGNFTVVYGCRGAGKSALLRSLLGLNKEIYENVSYKGSIKINNKDISSYEKKILRKIVTYIENRSYMLGNRIRRGRRMNNIFAKRDFLPNLKGKKLLLIGGTGFIGGRLLEVLHQYCDVDTKL